MKKIVLVLCWFIPVLANAQIQFQNLENWKQVLERAKQEHKNIFIDAFTTWCGPCKQMEREVYPNAQIGKFVNSTFIAVKLQFDQTEKDTEQIKKWYADTQKIKETYHIDAFPTFLFISPDEEIIQKDVGYHNVDNFLVLLKNANDPVQNYAGKVQAFKTGKLANEQLLSLAIKAKEMRQDNLALEIAIQYKRKFIDQFKPEKSINDLLPSFISDFYSLLSTRDPIVQFMYHKSVLADSMMRIKGYARRVSDNLIANELINPIIRPYGNYNTTLPDWDTIEKKVTKDYDPTTARRLIIGAKLGWYNHIKDWNNIIKYNIEQLEIESLDTAGMAASGLNNLSYDVIFQHSNDPYALNKAIAYMEIILKNNPIRDTWLDTYANLLYKVGRKEEAMKHEQAAINIAQKSNKNNILIYEDVLKKMRHNLPTWSDQ